MDTVTAGVDLRTHGTERAVPVARSQFIGLKQRIKLFLEFGAIQVASEDR